MSRLGQTLLKTLAITVALLFLLGAVVTASFSYLFGSKTGLLFEGSVNALAGEDDGSARRRARPRTDAGEGANATGAVDAGTAVDAGAASGAGEVEAAAPDGTTGRPASFDATKPGILREPRTYMPASKSLGGLGLPEARQQGGLGTGGLGVRGSRDAGP